MLQLAAASLSALPVEIAGTTVAQRLARCDAQPNVQYCDTTSLYVSPELRAVGREP